MHKLIKPLPTEGRMFCADKEQRKTLQIELFRLNYGWGFTKKFTDENFGRHYIFWNNDGIIQWGIESQFKSATEPLHTHNETGLTHYSEGIPMKYNGEKLLMLKEDEDVELVD